MTVASWGWVVELGSLRFGQSKDIVVRTDNCPDPSSAKIKVTLTYDYVGAPANATNPTCTSRKVEALSETFPQDYDGPRKQDLAFHRLRLQAVDAMYLSLSHYPCSSDEARTFLANLISTSNANTAIATNSMAQQLMVDIKGQVMEAFSKDAFFHKWGKHYVPSLAGAHLDQQCANFKDPGLQNYGGDLFKALQDRVDDIFNKLPAPKPSRVSRQQKSAQRSSNGPIRMSAYNCASAPCFHGSCRVSMANGTGTKLVKDIQTGDVVVATKRGGLPCKSTAKVLRILKTKCLHGMATLVTLPKSGLKVTEWHPVRRGGSWCFPASLGKACEERCDAVYSFLLEEETHCSMMINGEEVITLAHGIENDPVASHAYYGSRAVANDVEAMTCDVFGRVTLQAGRCVLRDKTTGLVCQLVQENPVSAVDCKKSTDSTIL